VLYVDNSNAQNLIGTNYLEISQQLLTNLKEGKETLEYEKAFAETSEKDITDQIITDEEKIAFWVNIYNAFIQIKLKEKPERYEKRNQFFKEEFIRIAGRDMSFSDIEHGIIRRSQWMYGLGRIRNPFAPGYQKRLAPSKKEPRIHFALNCGAKSCPPIAIYDYKSLDQQLNEVSIKFLKENTTYKKDNDLVYTTVLFSWFRGDFGGKSGVKKMLKEFNLIPNEQVRLKFDDYDWTLDLNNFIEE
tara:strand:- start:2941 stop:3675 length:735 start_codon:yes stop_codon:yes gene_type:complete